MIVQEFIQVSSLCLLFLLILNRIYNPDPPPNPPPQAGDFGR